MTSVNTNVAAMTALRTLQNTNAQLDATQNRISTGLKIGEAKDNAAYWSITTTLKSDNKSLATVKDALGLGAATVDTAYQGLNKAKEVLDEIKAKLTAATQPGIDSAAVQAEIKALQDQLTSIAGSSTFSGENWLSIDSSTTGFNPNKLVVASFSRDASNAVSIGTIDIDIADMALFDSNGAQGILDKQVALKNAAGAFMTEGGTDAAAAPATDAVDFSGVGTGSAAGSNESATVTLGTLNLAGVTAGDKIRFDLTVDGSSGVVELATDGLTTANFEASLQTAVDTAVGSGRATVAVAGDGTITIETVSTGGASSITVDQATGVDGDGIVTADLGLLNGSSLPLPAFGSGSAATTAAGNIGTTPTLASGTTLTFQIQYGTEVINVSQATAGAISDLATAETQLQTLIDTALAGVTGYTAGDVVVEVDAAGAVTFSTLAVGADQAVGVFGVVAGSTADTFGLANSATVGYGSSSAAKLDLGGAFDATGLDEGDTVKFSLNVGGTIEEIEVSTEGLTSGSEFQTRVQAALDTAFTAGVVTFNWQDTAAANNMTFSTTAVGSSAYIAISGVQMEDGDGVNTAVAGLTAVTSLTSDTGAGSGSASVASLTSGTAFTGTQTFGDNDTMTITVEVNGTATDVVIDRAAVEAGNGGSNVIANATQYAAVLDNAMTSLGIDVAADGGGFITLTKSSAAGVGTLEVTGVTSSAGADTMSITDIDITDAALTALGVDGTNRKEVLSAYISVVNDAINRVTSAASGLGAIAKRIELQESFVNTLMDTIDKGIGGLIDADMSEESTKLQALQVKSQLGVQALSIANQSAQNVLRLFQ